MRIRFIIYVLILLVGVAVFIFYKYPPAKYLRPSSYCEKFSSAECPKGSCTLEMIPPRYDGGMRFDFPRGPIEFKCVAKTKST